MPPMRRWVLLALIFMILTGLGHPGWVGAEEPIPTPFPLIGKPDLPVQVEEGFNPFARGSFSLSAPQPPEGCTSDLSNFFVNPNLPIPDNSTITSTLTLDGVDPYLWDVDLTTHIQHTFSSDLEVFLISPEGTEVTITTDNGNGYDNVFDGTIWDDQWIGLSVADYVYTNNVVAPRISPEEAMGAFMGEDPNGTWKLVVHDDANQDTGTLASWSLTLTMLPNEPNNINYEEEYSYPNIPIPDNGTLIQTKIYPAGIIHDLRTSIHIDHTNNADLDVWLVSPTGITVTLTTDNGGNLAEGFSFTQWGDDLGYINPPGPVTDVLFEDGEYEDYLVPENALSAFVGTEGGGTWTLIVKDDTVGNTGMLDLWGMSSHTRGCVVDLSVHQLGWFDQEINEPVPYTIRVRNDGSLLAENVLLTDTLPAGTTFLSWTPAPGWVCDTPPVGSSDPVTCSGPDILPDEVYTHTLQLSPISAPQPLFDNIVDISSSLPDIFPMDNHSKRPNWIRYRSANTNYWDVNDHLNFYGNNPSDISDDGAVRSGGQSAFSSWGALRIRVMDGGNTILTDNQLMEDFDLTFTGNGWVSNNTPSVSGISVNRTLFAPQAENYLRYLDTFTNNSNEVRQVSVAWGGILGSFDQTTLAATSSGDLTITSDDQWAFTIRNDTFNPTGLAESPPAGFLLRGLEDTSYLGTGEFLSNPFETPWPGNGNYWLAHVFSFSLQPGETKHLIYFLYRGLQEERAAPDYCTTNCYTPPAGSETALAQSILTILAVSPDFCDVPEEILNNVVNWPDALSYCSTSVYLPIITR